MQIKRSHLFAPRAISSQAPSISFQRHQVTLLAGLHPVLRVPRTAQVPVTLHAPAEQLGPDAADTRGCRCPYFQGASQAGFQGFSV